MTPINWTEIILGIIGLIFTGILIPVAKNFITAQKAKMTNEQLATFDYWSKKLVTVAELIFDGISQGASKKEWVIDQLIDKGIISEMDAEDVSDLIDAICKELTKAGLINDKKETTENVDEQHTLEGVE